MHAKRECVKEKNSSYMVACPLFQVHIAISEQARI